MQPWTSDREWIIAELVTERRKVKEALFVRTTLYYELFFSKARRYGRVNEGSYSFTCHPHVYPQVELGTERVQALADILRSALCCHSNETRSAIANPPNSAQLEGIPYHSPRLHPGPGSSVGMRRGADRHADKHTDGRDQYTFRLGYSSRDM